MEMIRIFFILCLAGLTGCGGALISSTQELQIGKGVDKQLKKEFSLVDSNDPVSKWAKELVRPLIKASAPFRDPSEVDGYRVEVIANDKLVNAFAAPGGFTYLSTGLILAPETARKSWGWAMSSHMSRSAMGRNPSKRHSRSRPLLASFWKMDWALMQPCSSSNFFRTPSLVEPTRPKPMRLGSKSVMGRATIPMALPTFSRSYSKAAKAAQSNFSRLIRRPKRIAAVKQQIGGTTARRQKKLSRQCRTKMTLAEVKKHIKSIK